MKVGTPVSLSKFYLSKVPQLQPNLSSVASVPAGSLQMRYTYLPYRWTFPAVKVYIASPSLRFLISHIWFHWLNLNIAKISIFRKLHKNFWLTKPGTMYIRWLANEQNRFQNKLYIYIFHNFFYLNVIFDFVVMYKMLWKTSKVSNQTANIWAFLVINYISSSFGRLLVEVNNRTWSSER